MVGRATKRQKVLCPIETANQKTSQEFVREYIRPSRDWTVWTHPKTEFQFSLNLLRCKELTDSQLEQCFDLIRGSSEEDYRRSSLGWHPTAKKKEMRCPDLRYIVVEDEDGEVVHGFASMMPTYEDGKPVVYCYEIHLKPELQGYVTVVSMLRVDVAFAKFLAILNGHCATIETSHLLKVAPLSSLPLPKQSRSFIAPVIYILGLYGRVYKRS